MLTEIDINKVDSSSFSLEPDRAITNGISESDEVSISRYDNSIRTSRKRQRRSPERQLGTHADASHHEGLQEMPSLTLLDGTKLRLIFTESNISDNIQHHDINDEPDYSIRNRRRQLQNVGTSVLTERQRRTRTLPRKNYNEEIIIDSLVDTSMAANESPNFQERASTRENPRNQKLRHETRQPASSTRSNPTSNDGSLEAVVKTSQYPREDTLVSNHSKTKEKSFRVQVPESGHGGERKSSRNRKTTSFYAEESMVMPSSRASKFFQRPVALPNSSKVKWNQILQQIQFVDDDRTSPAKSKQTIRPLEHLPPRSSKQSILSKDGLPDSTNKTSSNSSNIKLLSDKKKVPSTKFPTIVDNKRNESNDAECFLKTPDSIRRSNARDRERKGLKSGKETDYNIATKSQKPIEQYTSVHNVVEGANGLAVSLKPSSEFKRSLELPLIITNERDEPRKNGLLPNTQDSDKAVLKLSDEDKFNEAAPASKHDSNYVRPVIEYHTIDQLEPTETTTPENCATVSQLQSAALNLDEVLPVNNQTADKLESTILKSLENCTSVSRQSISLNLESNEVLPVIDEIEPTKEKLVSFPENSVADSHLQTSGLIFDANGVNFAKDNQTFDDLESTKTALRSSLEMSVTISDLPSGSLNLDSIEDLPVTDNLTIETLETTKSTLASSLDDCNSLSQLQINSSIEEANLPCEQIFNLNNILNSSIEAFSRTDQNIVFVDLATNRQTEVDNVIMTSQLSPSENRYVFDSEISEEKEKERIQTLDTYPFSENESPPVFLPTTNETLPTTYETKDKEANGSYSSSNLVLPLRSRLVEESPAITISNIPKETLDDSCSIVTHSEATISNKDQTEQSPATEKEEDDRMKSYDKQLHNGVVQDMGDESDHLTIERADDGQVKRRRKTMGSVGISQEKATRTSTRLARNRYSERKRRPKAITIHDSGSKLANKKAPAVKTKATQNEDSARRVSRRSQKLDDGEASAEDDKMVLSSLRKRKKNIQFRDNRDSEIRAVRYSSDVTQPNSRAQSDMRLVLAPATVFKDGWRVVGDPFPVEHVCTGGYNVSFSVLLDEYDQKARHGKLERIDFGPTLDSAKIAIDEKITQLRERGEDEQMVVAEAAMDDGHKLNKRAFAGFEDQERLERAREKEADSMAETYRLYNARFQRKTKDDSEMRNLVKAPIIFEQSRQRRMECSSCSISCMICHGAEETPNNPSLMPLYRRFDVERAEEEEKEKDDENSQKRSKRAGYIYEKGLQTLLALIELKNTILFIEQYYADYGKWGVTVS